MVNDSSIDRVVGELRRLAASGAIGEKLPSTRTLQQRLGVGPVTVQRALGRLVAEGRLVTRPGAGTFVAARRTVQASDTDWQQVALGPSPVQTSGLDVLFQLVGSPGFQLGAGYLDPALRADTRLAAAASRAARRPDAWASSPTAGTPELRSWFGRQIGAEPENVLITPGGQGALSATFRAILPAGHPVLFATPTYPGALAVARSAGHIPISVPGDQDGIRPELLREAFARTSARLLVIQPTYANPDGSVLAAQRRGEVLDICRRAGAFIVEDDFARWLGFAAVTPPPPLWQDDEHGQVITILSLTKVLAPSLRVGAVIARGPVMSRIAAMRIVDDSFVARPVQHTAIELVSGPAWAAQVRAVGRALRERAATLVAALARELPECSFTPPRGGVNLFLRLPHGIDDLAVATSAGRLGVAVAPGRFFTIGEQEAGHLRLSYAGIRAEDIPTAVGLLAQAVHAVAERAPGFTH
ncbi:PLP-dependent aminotransferase family protein [Frankia sp. AiPs1]|uniref:aminotransferase-like domain-containing protein n=1 Tax=Frankia sp. AiPs1 TaxID=573493 RepID=UPI002042D607|nr:PLP-dependent aminotransferase family protein [Frankia sp. AiPs1]MCM3923916.1 PLP-dependent aminotransferase family protein [Frankia sp. AiPs1]